MTITTRLHTLFCGKLVGSDQFGNRYYTDRKQKKRWVIFKGKAEPTKVPPQWHGWLHYTLDKPLDTHEQKSWQRPHVPNLTGTKGAYVPPGHLLRGGHRDVTTSDYEPWRP